MRHYPADALAGFPRSGVSYHTLTVECHGSCSRENATSHVVLAWRTPLEAPGLSFPQHCTPSRSPEVQSVSSKLTASPGSSVAVFLLENRNDFLELGFGLIHAATSSNVTPIDHTHSGPDNRVYLISDRPMTDEEWEAACVRPG